MSTKTAEEIRTRFADHIDSAPLDLASWALVNLDESTDVGMRIRVALIESIERRFPAVAEWVEDFYAFDGEPSANWNVDYPEAIMLARAALNM